ncbi:uncharacterized protein KD926_007338 [Aspergillus affinis]|uniref:uncharacterized protein n=1 Tax=Aspergillus affinis TaxID=1070780 RepID=UPI0022FEBCE8|nr:uncharacterized protein KD926_007338 [Aspergillus affinis]KAI9041069.1 hypothetical protein KD926_007338 [Aspergillus affinis]
MAGSQSSRVGTVRRAKACNTCRRKKTKCDGQRPICSSCHAFNFSCIFQDTVKEPNRSSRAYVADLERRVQSMEEQLQRQSPSGARHDSPLNADSLSTSDPDTLIARDLSEINPIQTGTSNSRPGCPDNTGDEDLGSTDYESGIDQTSYVINGRDGRMRFFGASSGLSVAAAHGAGRFGTDTEIRKLRSAVRKGPTRWQLTSWFPRTLQDDFERRVSQPLPSKPVTMKLVEEYFAEFNQLIPLFNKPSFMRLLKRQFSWNPDESPSWWASLNVVLAFAYRERAQAADENGENWQLSLAYIKNAMNVTVEFFMRAADLLTVQAMLGLAIYFQGTPNPQSLFMFASAAIRLAQSIGLHRGFTFGLTTPEIEERRRTFWIAFILDADISLRVGRPPAQDEHDYDTPLPPENPFDGKGVSRIGDTPINFFRLLSQLSLVQRRVYQHLYAATVQQRPRAIIVKEIKACEDALLQWKKSFPVAFDSHSACSQTPLDRHILRLKMAFLCCYANIYRVCMLAGQPSTNRGIIPPIEVEAAETVVASLDSARSAVGLIKHARSFGSSYQWNVLYFPAAASGTLALGIFMNPSHEKAEHDCSLICDIVKYLSEISAQEPGTYVDHVLGVCFDFETASKRALKHDPNGRHKRVENANTGNPYNASEHSKSGSLVAEGGMNVDLSTGPGTNHECLNDSTVDIQPSDTDIALFDLASDPMMNWQWSIPPFWNWQDMMSGSSLAPGTGNESSPDSYDPSFGA